MTEIFVEPEPGTSPDSTIRVPKGPLIGAAVLVALVFAVAITAKATGVGAAREAHSAPIEVRELRISNTAQGTLKVEDVGHGTSMELDADRNGFLFGVMRGIRYKRQVARADSLAPLRLTRWGDGTLTLDDPATGMHVAVESFGVTHVESFERLMRR